MAVFAASFVPVWVEDHEATNAATLRSGVSAFADAAEDHVARGLVGRTFSRGLVVGADGLPILGVGGSAGAARVTASPTVTVFDGATSVATGGGSLVVATDPVKHPRQTWRYAGGVQELVQTEGSWADVRALVSASRAAGGTIALAVSPILITGGPQEIGANAEVQATATVSSASTTKRDATPYVRILAEDVEAPAWRAAFNRTLEAASLAKAWSATCASSSADFCYASGTNTARNVDLYIRRVADSWTLARGTLAVEVRS